MAIQAGKGVGKIRLRNTEGPGVEAQQPKPPGTHPKSMSCSALPQQRSMHTKGMGHLRTRKWEGA